jgi:hypothetical protein
MAAGERPPKSNDLKPEDITRLGNEAVEKMRRRVESRLALDVPQEPKSPEAPRLAESATEPSTPASVTGGDVHTRSPKASEPSEPTPQHDQSGQILGRRRGRKNETRAVAPEAKAEPVVVAAVAADNPDEAAEIERLVQEAAAAAAAIAQESASDPIVVDAKAPGEVAPRRHALPLEPVAEEPDKDAGSIPAPVSVPEVLAPVQESEKKRGRRV